MNERLIQLIKQNPKATILVIVNIIVFVTNAYLGYQIGQSAAITEVKAQEERITKLEETYIPKQEYILEHENLADKVVAGLANLEGDIRDTNQKVNKIYDYLLR